MSRTSPIPAHPLLDYLLTELGLKNDAALSKALKVAPPAISKLRHQKIACGPALILRIHERLGVPVATIREFVPA